MGGLVTKRGTFGFWGSRLYVSTPEARQDNVDIWGVPAEVADIEYHEGGESLSVDTPPPISDDGAAPPVIRLSGWKATRSDERLRTGGWAATNPIGNLPVLWTPRLKILWSPLVPLPATVAPQQTRPLRLSASSLRLHLCAQSPSDDLGIPIPIGLSVDGLRIEIGDPCGEDL